MSAWVYFLHPPRENFIDTITDEESATMGVHFEHLTELFATGKLILAGPTLGAVNTGICVFEAPDEAAARAYMEADPTISSGIARGELREFRAAFLKQLKGDRPL